MRRRRRPRCCSSPGSFWAPGRFAGEAPPWLWLQRAPRAWPCSRAAARAGSRSARSGWPRGSHRAACAWPCRPSKPRRLFARCRPERIGRPWSKAGSRISGADVLRRLGRPCGLAACTGSAAPPIFRPRSWSSCRGNRPPPRWPIAETACGSPEASSPRICRPRTATFLCPGPASACRSRVLDSWSESRRRCSRR
jgi:hypothetical protein